MAASRKLILLLHGWLGSRRSFGRLPEELAAEGHQVLPVFRKYANWTPGLRFEHLAEQLEEELRRERPGAPVVVIAHSLGGLLARTWLLRHYAERHVQPPVEAILECGVPRHGLTLPRLARLVVRGGLVPGAGLVRQARAPNPFLWGLAWGEFRQAQWFPPTTAFASVLSRRSWLEVLVGGGESDGVVATPASNPNAVFARRGGVPGRLAGRAFRVFRDLPHGGRHGLLTRLASASEGNAGDAGSALAGAFRAWLRGEDSAPESPSAAAPPRVGRRLLVLRHGSLPAPGLRLTSLDRQRQSGDAGRWLRPASSHPDGLALFDLDRHGRACGESLAFAVRCGEQEWSGAEFGLPEGLPAGSTCYLDLVGADDRAARSP